jgi:hypothetical protein
MKKILYLLLFSLISASPAAFLQAQIPEIPRFTLSATAVGLDKVPELYWLDLKIDFYEKETREPQLLDISMGSRGSSVAVPIRSPIQLFRKVTLAEGGITYEPVMEIPRQEGNDRLLLLFYRKADGSGSVQFFDDSTDAHPAGAVRFINMSSGKAVAAIGNAPQVIDPGTSVLLGSPKIDATGRFPLDVAAKVPGKPNYRDPTKLLSLRSPAHRLLVLFTFLPVTQNDTNGTPLLVGYTPIAYRLYDRIAPPEKDQ